MAESGPLSDEKFAALAEDYVLFCSIDSKVKDWNYGSLRTDKKLQGIPSVVYLDGAGTVLLQVSYKQRSVAGFKASGVRARRYVWLRKATGLGDRKAAARFLRMQLEERQLDLEEAVKRRSKVEASVRLAGTLDRLILHLRISTEMRAKGQRKRFELGPRFFKMWKNGPRPGPGVSRGFWFAILEWAERENKVEIFAEALEGFRINLAHTDPGAIWVPRMLGNYEAKLKKLRAGRR